MVPEGTMPVSKEGRQPTVLPSYDAYEPQGPAWYDNRKGAVCHVYKPFCNWT